MASTTKEETKDTKTTKAPTETAVPKFDTSKLEGLINVAARLPQYDGGDGRMVKKGHEGPPINGYLLGTIDLPSKQKDEDGNSKPWVAVVIELLQPCPVKEKIGDETKSRVALKGERILLTENKAFERFSRAADNPHQVVEAYIVPRMSENAKGQPLWIFPTVGLGRPRPRVAKDAVGMGDFEALPEPEVHNALPENASS